MSEAKRKEEKQAEKKGEVKKQKKRKGRITVFVISAAVGLLLLVYCSIALYYQTHFLPNTKINGINCSNINADKAAGLLEGQRQNYVLEVTGRELQISQEDNEISENQGGGEGRETKFLLGTLYTDDIDFSMSGTLDDVQALLKSQNPLLWIRAYTGNTFSYDLTGDYIFDEKLLEQIISGWEAFQTENMTDPEDAYISAYSENGYEIIPGSQGTRLNIDAARETIAAAVYAGETTVDLDEAGCYEEAAVTADNQQLVNACSTMNTWVGASITYDWNGTEIIVAGEKIQEWITVENGDPVLDEEAVEEFVAETARELDTYGKNRKFTTAMGVELTLPSGAYGWRTDREGETQELIELIYQGSVTEKEPAYISRAAVKGSNDIGSSYVEIDLSYQHLYLFWDGEIVLETDFVSGDMSRSGRMTPPGVFGLTYKTKNAVLKGDDYETPVNYWMPFNGNIGMHDATWRSSFGGDIYLTNGSHGCINLPLRMAAQIYEYVDTGFPVICYYY